MSDFPELSARLQALLQQETEAPSTLSAEQRQQITAIFAEACEDDRLELAAVVQRALDEQPGHLLALYARATAEELAEEKESAGNLYLQIVQALASQKDWEGVLAVAVQAMPMSGDYRLVRLVRRAGEKGNLDITVAMQVAQEECADSPDLLWEQSREADERGDIDEGLKLALAALEGYVGLKEPEHAEDPLLRALEANDVATYERLLAVMRRMAAAGQVELLSTAFELAEEKLFDLDMAEDLADALVYILEKRPELAELRKLYARAIIKPLGGYDALQQVAAETGLDNPAVPIEDALAAFQEAAAFSPGAYVSHRSWGVGRITRHEDDELTIDFEEKPQHKMAAQMAKSVLLPLSRDSLQVQRATGLDALKREADDNPANIVYRLMMESGGEIVTPDIKMRLTPWLVREEGWSTWWRKARKAIEEDRRIDSSQAFRHLYREAQRGGEPEVPLLNLDPRKGIKGAISMIHKLLSQHPQTNERAKMHYGRTLRDWLKDTHKLEDWVRALPLMERWYPEREAEWLVEAEKALPSVPLTLAGEEPDQMVLLELGLKSRAWKDAAFSALSSRFDSVKEKGLQVLGERARDTLWEDFTDLLTTAGHYQQKMAVAEMILNKELTRDDTGDELPIDPWILLHATLSVVASKSAHAGRGMANRLLKAAGPLVEALKGRELSEEMNEIFNTFRRRPLEGEVQLAVEALLQAVEKAELAHDILRIHQPYQEDEAKPPELDPRLTLMTRQTLETQTERMREMEHQLAVEIPQEIAKARALGDLSENAEYHAARERQGITKALYDNLLAQMETALAIEDVHRAPGVAGVGKEVRLREVESGEEQSVWVLGEGDTQYGHDVVSYKAPLGQALVGKKVGDVAQVGEDGPQYEVLAIEEKMP
ncbi:MAG: GreA/GreB family elongation factor [Armatimonadia bacterium]